MEVSINRLTESCFKVALTSQPASCLLASLHTRKCVCSFLLPAGATLDVVSGNYHSLLVATHSFFQCVFLRIYSIQFIYFFYYFTTASCWLGAVLAVSLWKLILRTVDSKRKKEGNRACMFLSLHCSIYLCI